MKKNNKIIYQNFFQNKSIDLRIKKKLDNKFSKIINNIFNNLNNTKDTFHSLSNKFEFNFKIKDLNKFKKFNTVVVIGMGGSILGTEAIYSFLENKIKKNFLFFDNIDEDNVEKLKKKYLLNKVLFIIISKSGNTIETLANIITLKIIKKESKNIIVISEKKNNALYLISKKMNLFHVEHKNYIGGRYSVLSEVGMLPAYFMGINIFKIRKNLLNHFKLKKKVFLKNSTVNLANLLIKNKFKNLIFFNYTPQLNNFLYWCQQLMAESLGKKGRGFLPIVSPAPKDHHSLLQLYLDGPKDKMFYIFSNISNKKNKINSKILDKRFNFLNKKNLSQIKTAQKNAFLKVLKKKNIPYREFRLTNTNEETLGELFSYFMLETSIVGMLANIDPFNQPAVEQVKVNTKNFLV